MFVAKEYVKKIAQMKKDGLAKTVQFLVCFDAIDKAMESECSEAGLKLLDMQAVMDAGKGKNEPFRKCTENDSPLFSYTSGTTGDSKGVKLTHKNLLASSVCVHPFIRMNHECSYISYLPYPHSFEQCLTFYTVIIGSKCGFYQGDPLKLTEDCQILKPTLFPSVPRLFNKIYGKIKKGIDEASGCKGWIAKTALNSKMANVKATGAVGHGCYDKIVFKKMAAILGGQVKYMITGSAPIDSAVLDFLKVCFCCPMLEGYGLTETSGGSAVTHPMDPVTGHVGGPLPCIKWRLMDVPEMSYLSSDKPYPRGELQMYGPAVFSGYYKRPDKTAEAFDSEGWFKTGDVAMVYPNGSVKIIDRSKNIFKLSQGEYIAPEKLENMFALSPWVA